MVFDFQNSTFLVIFSTMAKVPFYIDFMIKRHIPEAFYNSQSWSSFSSISNVANMTSLDLSIDVKI